MSSYIIWVTEICWIRFQTIFIKDFRLQKLHQKAARLRNRCDIYGVRRCNLLGYIYYFEAKLTWLPLLERTENNLTYYYVEERRNTLSLLLLLLLFKKGRQCKAEIEWCTPYQSEDPSPTIPTNRQKEEKGKKSRRL